jgi:hypothetical protein
MAEPEGVDGSLSGYARYVRRLYGEPWFPKLDDNGLVYLSGKAGVRGWQGKNSKFVFCAEDAVTRHLKQHFPQRGVHTLSELEFRTSTRVVGRELCLESQ